MPLKLSDLRMLRKAVTEAGLLREEHRCIAAEVVAHRSNMQRLMAATEKAEARLRTAEGGMLVVDAKLRQIKAEEAALSKSVDALREQNNDLDKRRKVLREAYSRDLDGDPVKSLKKELASMQARIDQWRAKNIQLASQVDRLKEANAKGSKALNEMTDWYEELKADVDRKGTEKEAKLNRRRRLFGQLLSGGTA